MKCSVLIKVNKLFKSWASELLYVGGTRPIISYPPTFSVFHRAHLSIPSVWRQSAASQIPYTDFPDKSNSISCFSYSCLPCSCCLTTVKSIPLGFSFRLHKNYNPYQILDAVLFCVCVCCSCCSWRWAKKGRSCSRTSSQSRPIKHYESYSYPVFIQLTKWTHRHFSWQKINLAVIQKCSSCDPGAIAPAKMHLHSEERWVRSGAGGEQHQRACC